MPRRYYSSTAVETTLTNNVSNSATTLPVASTSGFPGSLPYTLILDEGTVSEEIVTVTAVASLNLTVTRGADGTTAVSHSNGATVKHGVSARDFDETNAHVNDTTTDVHTQYVTKALVNAKGDLVTATANDTPAVLTVGANDTVLTADSSTATGLAWKAASGGISNTLLDAKGDLIAASANDTAARLAAGSNGQMLMADSSATAGLRYVDPPTNRNLVINGAMQVHQRGTSVAASPGGYNTADRWNQQTGSLGVYTQSVETDAPTGSGLRKSLKMLCTTAETTLTGTRFVAFEHRIEGQDLQRLKKGTASAESVSLSFWVKSNVTGTYIVELRDNDNTRHICGSYTVNASATWERKTFTFAGDTTGVLDNDNGVSMTLLFWLAAGTDFTSGTLATAWASTTTANRAVGQTNLSAATNNYWQVTGVQLETGPVATPFEFEPYEATLRKCQRYYYRQSPGTADYPAYRAQGAANSATQAYVVLIPPVPLRTKASAVEYSNIHVSFWTSGVTATSVTLNTSNEQTPDAVRLIVGVASGLTARDPILLMGDNNANTYLAVSAEL